MPIRISGSTGISGLDGSSGAPVYAGANSDVGLFISGNTVNVSANSISVGTTVISNSGVSVSGIAMSSYSGMMKNRLINGDFRIDQRFSGLSNNNIVGSQYVVDRWRNNGTAAAKLKYQQNNINGPGSSATQIATGFSNYFGANVVSSNTVNAGDYWGVAQDVEGLNISDLGWGTANASPVALSFWVYSSVPGTHSGSIRNFSGDRAYSFTYNINTANTWQHQKITIPGDTTGQWLTNTQIGLTTFFSLGVGSTYSTTAGSWQTGNYFNASGAVNVVSNANGSFYLTGVQLEEGSVATAFDFRNYGVELHLCQRYFEEGTEPYLYLPISGGLTAAYGEVRYATTKRASSTVKATSWTYFSGGGSAAFTPGVNGGNLDKFTFTGTGFTTWNGWAGGGTWWSSAELVVQN